MTEVAQVVTILAYVYKAPGSNQKQDANFSHWNFSWFIPVLRPKARRVLQIRPTGNSPILSNKSATDHPILHLTVAAIKNSVK